MNHIYCNTTLPKIFCLRFDLFLKFILNVSYLQSRILKVAQLYSMYDLDLLLNTLW
jgi:hypothetical protein